MPDTDAATKTVEVHWPGSHRKQVTMTGQMNSNLDISYCYLGLDFIRPRLEDIDIYAIHF